MYVLHIEHTVPDYQRWRAAGFDSDPLGRKQSGVRRHRVYRRSDAPNHVVIELEFETADASAKMGERLRKMWVGAQERGLINTPSLTSLELADAMDY
ncbi:MAG: hypothetical protein HY834_10220 [Devosia nanyangense]|uniref:Cyclase n=1 Tax=Devosia nanyangense TaxID=1228055 RepID=A0A933NYC4_9HYPH|nr:hypothetical protein [Devosia nanyangense]